MKGQRKKERGTIKVEEMAEGSGCAVTHVFLVGLVVVGDSLRGHVSVAAVGYLQVPGEAVQALAVLVAQVHEGQAVVPQRTNQTVYVTLERHNTGESLGEHWESTGRALGEDWERTGRELEITGDHWESTGRSQIYLINHGPIIDLSP